MKQITWFVMKGSSTPKFIIFNNMVL